MEDRRVKAREITNAVGISSEHVHKVLHEQLDVKKLCARWAPRLSTVNQKLRREDVSIECSSLHKRNPSEFLRRFITIDRVHHYTPDSRDQLKQ